jgi:hypothetical protein
MIQAMSDTPRTDAEEQWAEWNGQEFKCVHASFARELERELSDLRDTERSYDALIDATVGAKMIAPTPQMLEAVIRDALRYRWLRDEADGPKRDTALDTPCGHTPDEPEDASAHAMAVDDAIDAAMGARE